MKHKLGLVLSGGGVKGAAHIGALKALAEHGVDATCISGTSAGAIIGALYAAEKSADEIFDIFQNSHLFSLSRFAFGKPGFIDIEKFVPYFQDHLSKDDFKFLSKEVFITATDLVKATAKIFDSGSLITAMLASSAFPLVFSPLRVKDALYADGGIINNFPVEPLIGKCESILGVYVSPIKKIGLSKLTSSWSVMERAYQISNRYASLQKMAQCDWVIHPQELERFGTFDMNKAGQIFEIGYESTLEMMDVILEGIKSATSTD